jgi:hypothetical protein
MATNNNNVTPPAIITELDYDTILENIKNWMRSQDTFKDYDFDGPALAILLKNLAYNTHYNAFYTNMVANEAFIGSALLPRSVYSHAKSLNYLPSSRNAASATVDITVTPPVSYFSSSFTIPKYQPFISESIDGVAYGFVTNEDYIASRTTILGSQPFEFNDVVLYQGEPVVIRYNVDQISNPKLRFEIPSANVDVNTLTVQVQVSAANSAVTTWELSTDITAIEADTQAYFLERGSNGNYTVYFGDGNIGAQPNTGNILILSYIVTHGSAANKVSKFTMLPLSNVDSVIVSTTSVAAGGDDEEDVTSIKVTAPIYYASQNRAVTKSDFEVIIKKDFPQISSVSVWGGEENNPPIYGKIFVALSPKSGFFISEAMKKQIVDTLVANRVTLSLKPEVIDPEYVYVRVKTTAEYNKNLTRLSKDAIVTGIRNAIIDYNEDNLRLFGSKFILSKLTAAIDAVDSSILGNDTKVYLEKRFTPTIGRAGTYTLNFNTELKRGSILEKLGSSPFQVADSNGITRTAYFEEKQLSYTGVDDIVVTNPGFGYLEAPTVTVTGDGSGCNAVAKIVNGRVQSVKVIDKGENYTTGVVTLTAVNGGTAATAKPIIAARYGTLRIYYYNETNQKVIIKENAGTIDYAIGQIVINAFNPVTYDDYITLWIQTEDPIIESSRGNILIIDNADPSSINIDLQESKR